MPGPRFCDRRCRVNVFPSHRHATQPTTWITAGERAAFEAAGTNAHRLASGPDGWVERLGDDAMISHKNDVALAELAAGLEAWSAQANWTPARVFTRFLPLKNHDRVSPILRSGDASLPITTVVAEAGIRYGLDFGTGYNHGLFLDQRLNRAKLRALKPRRLLNTFAYTCSFSVVAALAGAETMSADLSRKSLDRGRHNFELNGIDESKHRFMVDDTLELLPKLAARGERFDAIVLDPPTYSRNAAGRRWQVENDFEDLLSAALEVAAPKCAILLSTNCTKLDPATLERRARWCAKTKHRTAEYLRLGTPPDFPPGHGASTLWMMVR